MLHLKLIDCGTSKIPELISLFKHEGFQIGVVLLAEANEVQFNQSDAVVISGGPHLFTDSEVEPELVKKFAFLDTLDVPALGICLGHQAMGVRAGVTAYRGEERRETDVISPRGDHELFRGLPSSFPMREDHCEGIPLPEGYLNLASSEFYEVEAMAALERPFWGVQFHPEMSEEPGKILIRNFCRMARGIKD